MATTRLPLFPLGLVLLPGEPVPLHIFEPRYKELVRVSLEAEAPFGVVYASESGLSTVGTAARIHNVATRYEDGRLDILVVGESRFRISEVYRDLDYLSADTTPVADESTGAPADHKLRSRVIARHMKLLELAHEPLRTELYETEASLSFLVGQNAGLDLEAKQALLEMTGEHQRLEVLAAHLEQLLKRVRKAKTISDLARGDGHATGVPGIDPPEPPSKS